MRWTRFPGAAMVVLLLAACIGARGEPGAASAVAGPGSADAEALIGRPRPGFTLEEVDGDLRRAAEWDGKLLVVNFWASWCVPCLREIPSFVDLQQAYRDQGLQFVGIALDNRRGVEGFLEDLETPVNYPLLIADGDAGIDLATAYGNRLGVLPYTVVVDRGGVIRYAQFGELEHDDAERLIRKLL